MTQSALNPSGKVSKAAQHALLRVGKKEVSQGKFIRTLMHQYDQDVKTGEKQAVSRMSMLKTAKAVARGELPPGSTTHQLHERDELLKEMGETHFIKGEGKTTQKLEYRQYAVEVKKTAEAAKSAEGKDDIPSAQSRSEERKKEARHRQDMQAQARERRREAEQGKGGKINASTSALRQGASTAEEAAKASKEKGKEQAKGGDWRDKPVVDAMLD